VRIGGGTIAGLLLGAILVVAAPSPAVAAGKPKKPVTCSEGKTLLQAPHRVRVFRVGHPRRWLVCSRWVHKPVRLQDAVWADIFGLRLCAQGDYVVSAWHWDNGETAAWQLVWVNIRTGASRFADLGTGDHADEPNVRSVAVAPDGAMAYVDTAVAGEERIGFVATNRHRSTRTWKTLASEPAGTVAADTLRFDGAVIRWDNVDGTQGSVARPKAG
jgi:hypothetical protein